MTEEKLIGLSGRLRGWRRDLFMFDGFKMPVKDQWCWGRILWTGIVTFRTGIKLRVLYRVTVTVPPKASDDFLVMRMQEGTDKALFMVNAGLRGYLINPLNGRKARKVESVEWQSWEHCADPPPLMH